MGSTKDFEIFEAAHPNYAAAYKNMVDNSIRPEIIAKKWAVEIISMRHNEVAIVVALDVEMGKKGYTMI